MNHTLHRAVSTTALYSRRPRFTSGLAHGLSWPICLLVLLSPSR